MIFAIGDLHLGFSLNKPMDIFGSHWEKHYEKIKENWQAQVSDDDLIIICGDISWALKLEEAKEDINWINSLKGYKVMVKGNHDLWWSSLNKMQNMFVENTTINFLHNTSYEWESKVICGTRGWKCEGSLDYTEVDAKIYHREGLRLRQSLEEGSKTKKEIVVAMHYPPMNEKRESSVFTDLFQEYGVKDVIYGHLHDEESFATRPQDEINGIRYHLVSADYLQFNLKKIG